jgi:hypothetical protein
MQAFFTSGGFVFMQAQRRIFWAIGIIYFAITTSGISRLMQLADSTHRRGSRMCGEKLPTLEKLFRHKLQVLHRKSRRYLVIAR